MIHILSRLLVCIVCKSLLYFDPVMLFTKKVFPLLFSLTFVTCIIVPPVKKTDPDPGLYWCPPLPNCASTESLVPFLHKTDSFDLRLPVGEAWPVILETVGELPRTEITVQWQGYLHAKSHSLVFHFIDYFEVLAQPEENKLAVRSSAMLGITDFWVNYRRVHTFRDMLIRKGVIQKD